MLAPSPCRALPHSGVKESVFSADNTWMSPEDQLATAALSAELAQLEAEEREISAYRRKLHDRIDRFPSEAAISEEREVSGRRRELHRRIDELRELLG
jgi:hypothetical protein